MQIVIWLMGKTFWSVFEIYRHLLFLYSFACKIFCYWHLIIVQYSFSFLLYRYFLKVTIVRRLSDIVKEMDIAVHTLSLYPEMNNRFALEYLFIVFFLIIFLANFNLNVLHCSFLCFESSKVKFCFAMIGFIHFYLFLQYKNGSWYRRLSAHRIRIQQIKVLLYSLFHFSYYIIFFVIFLAWCFILMILYFCIFFNTLTFIMYIMWNVKYCSHLDPALSQIPSISNSSFIS